MAGPLLVLIPLVLGLIAIAGYTVYTTYAPRVEDPCKSLCDLYPVCVNSGGSYCKDTSSSWWSTEGAVKVCVGFQMSEDGDIKYESDKTISELSSLTCDQATNFVKMTTTNSPQEETSIRDEVIEVTAINTIEITTTQEVATSTEEATTTTEEVTTTTEEITTTEEATATIHDIVSDVEEDDIFTDVEGSAMTEDLDNRDSTEAKFDSVSLLNEAVDLLGSSDTSAGSWLEYFLGDDSRSPNKGRERKTHHRFTRGGVRIGLI